MLCLHVNHLIPQVNAHIKRNLNEEANLSAASSQSTYKDPLQLQVTLLVDENLQNTAGIAKPELADHQ